MLVLGAVQEDEPCPPTPRTWLGRQAEGNLYHYLKEAQYMGTKSPGDSLGLEVAAEKGVPTWLLRAELPSSVLHEAGAPVTLSQDNDSLGLRGTQEKEGKKGRTGTCP